MKTLVLAEKPSVGRELARVLGCPQGGKSFLEGGAWIVTWALGHLVELADPETYEERWKTWNLESLPMLPKALRLSVIRRSAHQFNAVKQLLHRQDVGELVIATDAGREGELVARWILRLAGWKGTTRRLWISSQTDAAIREGFASLKPAASYENLFRAAECRAEADWIVGLNLTRALSCRYDTRLSAGRVQTPTLALVAAREKDIGNFRPEAYWTVQADFGAFRGVWQGPGGATRLKDAERARAIADKVRGARAVIVEAVEQEKSDPPPPAHDLTLLQKEASALLGFGVAQTLSVLQGLYERHKIVSYPRTDSRCITTDMVPTLPGRLRALAGTRFRTQAEQLLHRPLSPGKRLVDDAKVRDHHAIIPTEEPVHPERLAADERALWELIARRFLAVLSPPCRFTAIRLVTEAAGERFLTRGSRVIEAGWRAVAGNLEEEEPGEEELAEQSLAQHRRGEELAVKEVDLKQGFTRPPPRYTEGTLVAAMEAAGRFVEDKELARSIERGGIGTPATRAEIIEKLLDHWYVEKRGKELAPTARGLELLELVPEPLRSPELTARWESRLARVADGLEPAEDFRADIRSNASQLVAQVKASTAEYRPRNPGATPCPVCGRPLLAVQDRRGRKILACQALSCGYEQGAQAGDGPHRPSPREKAITRRMLREFSDDTKETSTLGDLLRAAQEKKLQKEREADHPE
jgi:DNA topoisomerase-3